MHRNAIQKAPMCQILKICKRDNVSMGKKVIIYKINVLSFRKFLAKKNLKLI
jgi:hypothetical protein